MNDILCKQLAIDYCCSEEEVRDERHHFTTYQFLEGRRRFREETECYLKVAVINGKLLFSGAPEMMNWCKEKYADADAEWFFEAKNIRGLNDRLHEDGYQIKMMHPFFISEMVMDVQTDGYDICWYHEEEIEQFRENNRYPEAYSFYEGAPDVIGVSAIKDGKILGMAGASSDSPWMWQIGINVEKEARKKGIATMLVTLLKNEILRGGHLPYYGTGFSHIASQRVALGAGFLPTWTEIATAKMEKQ